MKAHLFASVSAQAILASGGGNSGNLPVDAAHRYWRVRVVRWAVSSSYEGLSGLQVYAGGVNVGPQASLSADRSVQAGSLSEILNYVTNTTLCQFAIGQGDSATLTLDFGSTPRKVDGIGVYPNKDEPNRSPAAFWIEWSDDATAWTPKAFCRLEQGETWAAGTEKVFNIPAVKSTSQIWAIFGWQPSGSIGELSMLRGNTDLTTGQTAFSSGQYSSGEDAAKAIDDNDSTNWSGADESNGSTLLGVQFATAVQPVKVGIQSRNDSQYWTQTPWQNVWLGYGDDRRTYRVKTELTKGQTSNPYNGPVQNKVYDSPEWISGPGPNAHRYWRIRGVTQGAGDNTQYSEIEFRNAPGGPNLATGGTAMASSWYDQPNGTTWHYNNAFDGNINTNWAAAGTIPNWIGYDFGKKVEITEIAMRESSAADQYWSSMAVDYSDNGTTWTEYGVLVGVPKVNGWRTYSEILRQGNPDEGWDQPHRYWRLVTLQWPTLYQGINEIRLMNGVTDLIAANGGSPSADAAQGGYGPEKAFDNNTSTGWADNATNVSHWLQWDFGSGNAFAVTDYKLTAWSGLMPTGWKLQFSDDGAVWKSADTRLSQPAWAGEETRGFLLGPITPPLRGYSDLGFTIKGAWATRRIVDGYTGPLLRVRDTTTNAESDLGIDTDGKVVPFSGAPPAVVKVYDQSGNGADIGQTDTTRQPLLIYEATKNGFAAIRFDGNDDFLKDPVAATNRPYMTAKIVSNQVYSRSAGSEQYGSGVSIPHNGGANDSPYKRWGWNWGSDGSLDFRINGVGAFSLPMGGGRFPFMDQNGGLGALQTWGTDCRMTGLRGYSYSVNNSDNAYPNASGIYIGANGAGDENWAMDFVELVMGEPGSGTADAFCDACDRIVAALMLDDYEVTALRVKYPGTAGGEGFSAAEIEMLTASNVDLTTAALKLLGTHRYSPDESWEKAFDDDNATLWSGNIQVGQGRAVVAMRLAANAPRELPTHGTHRVRNDSYVTAGSIKTMIWSFLGKDGWQTSADIVLPDGPTAGQLNSFTVSFP